MKKYVEEDKFVVFGGAGFIGSHITEKLLSQGAKVIVVDDFSTGFMENLSFHSTNPNLTIVRMDISDWTQISQNFSYFQNVKGVFHLAALARIQPSVYAPMRTYHVNLTGTLHVLELMRMCNIKNIVYSASSSYYGKQVTRASVETDQPDCQTSYSASKYAAEILIKTWGKSYQIRNVSLRYFNVYGRRSPLVGAYAPVVGLFFRQALVGQPLTVVGDGEQRRDFTHVSDVVEANILAMDKLNSLEYEKITNLTLNIGTGKNYSINEVANMVKKTLTDNCAVKIKNTPERVGEAHMSLANNELALGCLGWRPSIALAEGLDDLKKYYTNNMKKFGAEGDLIL